MRKDKNIMINQGYLLNGRNYQAGLKKSCNMDEIRRLQLRGEEIQKRIE